MPSSISFLFYWSNRFEIEVAKLGFSVIWALRMPNMYVKLSLCYRWVSKRFVTEWILTGLTSICFRKHRILDINHQVQQKLHLPGPACAQLFASFELEYRIFFLSTPMSDIACNIYFSSFIGEASCQLDVTTSWLWSWIWKQRHPHTNLRENHRNKGQQRRGRPQSFRTLVYNHLSPSLKRFKASCHACKQENQQHFQFYASTSSLSTCSENSSFILLQAAQLRSF